MGFTSHETAAAMRTNDFDTLILELNDLVDKISFILRQIEMDMYETEEYFTGEVANSIRNKFKTYSIQNQTLINNLLSYPKDLMNVKISMYDNDSKTVTSLNEFSSKFVAEAKNVSYKEEI